MTRLIDADAFEVYGTTVPDGMDAESYMAGACEVLEKIDAMPTVDAVPVIRCKDCKYYEPYDCGLHTGTWFPESYCDMAERKEE